MKLKMYTDGHVVVQDGKPVYVRDDGSDFVADVPDMHKKVVEGKKSVDDLTNKLKVFDGIDAEKARKAIEITAAIGEGKLADAEALRREVTEAVSKNYETKLAEITKRAGDLETSLVRESIGGRFARSSLLGDKPGQVILPADMMEATFGRNFKLENGVVTAYDNHGNKLYSNTRTGELADFDEALGILVNQHPAKDRFVVGSGSSGSGTTGSESSGGKKLIKRDAFLKMSSDEQAVVSNEISSGKATFG